MVLSEGGSRPRSRTPRPTRADTLRTA